MLIEEYILVEKSKGVAIRRLDGLIISSEESAIKDNKRIDIKNLDVIAVQTKATKLGMSVIGQAIISRDILLSKKARSVRCVIICSETDLFLEAYCEKYSVEVVIIPNF